MKKYFFAIAIVMGFVYTTVIYSKALKSEAASMFYSAESMADNMEETDTLPVLTVDSIVNITADPGSFTTIVESKDSLYWFVKDRLDEKYSKEDWIKHCNKMGVYPSFRYNCWVSDNGLQIPAMGSFTTNHEPVRTVEYADGSYDVKGVNRLVETKTLVFIAEQKGKMVSVFRFAPSTENSDVLEAITFTIAEI